MKNRLLKVLATGGEPVVISEIAEPYLGGAWNPNAASIVFAVDHQDIYEVSARGGAPKLILKPDPERWNHFEEPQFLPPPHSSLLLFSAQARTGQHMSILHSFASGQQEVVNQQEGRSTYSPTGHLLATSGSLLWAMPFSPER